MADDVIHLRGNSAISQTGVVVKTAEIGVPLMYSSKKHLTIVRSTST